VDDRATIAALRAGDEEAFAMLVREHNAALLRVARMYVKSRAAAEDVVADTWLGVFRGIDRFEGRSSLKTWIFRILTNTAKTRAQREGRSVPFSAIDEVNTGEAAVERERFTGTGYWAAAPRQWPERELEAAETREVIQRAIDSLPEVQRAVITLRDIEGWSAEDVCNALELSETNQRVLLHRARAKVRRALDQYLMEAE
jgi:RNA polymerase sigma-70 factor, ECF subfamily